MKQNLKLTPKPGNRLNVKRAIVITSGSIIAGAIITFVLFFYFNIGSPEKAYAKKSTFNSAVDGMWSMEATWNRGDRPDNPVNHQSTININEGTKVTAVSGGDLNFRHHVKLNVYGTLVVRNSFDHKHHVDISVEDNGILIVMEDYEADHHLNLTNSGRIVFLGNVNTAHQSNIINNGTIYTDSPLDITSGDLNLPISSIQYDQDLVDLLSDNGYLFTTLPVDLLHFGVSDIEDDVLVEWSCVTETNNDFFTIERSVDGKNYEVLAIVEGAGNSKVKTTYEFVDSNPLEGMAYYRLKQTDFDGQFEYFSPEAISREKVNQPIAIQSVGPNPFQDVFRVSYSVPQSGEVMVMMYNLEGNKVYEEKVNAYAGNNEYKFTSASLNLKSDMYLFSLVQNGEVSEVYRLIKR